MLLPNAVLCIFVSLWFSFKVVKLNVREKSTISSNHPKDINVTCIIDKYGMGYIGTRNTTYDGLPCMQWPRSGFLYQKYKLRIKNISGNYCRNINGLDTGPWCLAYKHGTPRVIRCGIPLCQSKLANPKHKIVVGVSFLLKRKCPFGFEEVIIRILKMRYSNCVVKQEFLSKLPIGQYSLMLKISDNKKSCPENFKIDPKSFMFASFCTRTDSTSDFIEFPKYLTTPEPGELIFVALKLGMNSTCPKMSGKTYVLIRVLEIPSKLVALSNLPGKITTCHYFSKASKTRFSGFVDRRLAILVLQNNCPENWSVSRRFLGWKFLHVFNVRPKNACMPDKDVLNYPDGDYCLLSLDVKKGKSRQCPEEFINVDIKYRGKLETKFCCTQSYKFGNSNEKIYDFFNVSSLIIINSNGKCEKIPKKDIGVKQYTMEPVSFTKFQCTNCDLFDVFVEHEYHFNLSRRFIKNQLKVCSYEKETRGIAYLTLNGRCPKHMNYAYIKYSLDSYTTENDVSQDLPNLVTSFCTIWNYPQNISFPEGRYCIYKLGNDCPLGFQPVKSELPSNYYKLGDSGGDITNNDMTYYCCKFGPKNISFENATLPYVTKNFEFGLPYPNSSFSCVHGLATHTAAEDYKMCHYYPSTDKSPQVSIVFPSKLCSYRMERYNGSYRPMYFNAVNISYCNFHVNDRPPPGTYCAPFSRTCPPKYFDFITFHPLMEHVICCRKPVQNDTREKEYTATGWVNDLKYFSLLSYRKHCPVFERYNYGKDAAKRNYTYIASGISADYRKHLTDIGFRILPTIDGLRVSMYTCYYELDLYDKSVTWPHGQYAFPKPISGCPSSFKSGEFTHSKNSANPSFAHSDTIHLDGDYMIGGSTIKWGFCVRNNISYKHSIPLPYGRYCLMKVDYSCPRGFREGSVRFVEFTALNKSLIRREGVLPKIETDGSFITYHFCCQSGRGDIAHEPIYLPTQHGSFYLMKYGTYCQNIFGMRFTEEFICIDSEDSSQYLNYTFQVPYNVEGATPVTRGSNKGCDFKINLCYYELGTLVAAPLTSKPGPLVDWPIGSYVFFKPYKRLCPFGFDAGAIVIQSIYNLYPKFVHSVMLRDLDGNNAVYSYCKRNSSVVDKFRPAENWPPGNYCLIFERQCPPGMLRIINHGFHKLTSEKQTGAQMSGWSILCCQQETLSNGTTLPYFPGDYYSFIIQPTRDLRVCPPHRDARVALVDMRTEILCIYERLDESIEFPDGDYLLPAPQAPMNACAHGFKLVEHRHFPFQKYEKKLNTQILRFCQKERNATNNATFPRGNYCVLTTNEICPTSQFTMENYLFIPLYRFGDKLQKFSRYLACCQKEEKIISNIAISKAPFALYGSSNCSYIDGLRAVWESKEETVLVQPSGVERPPFNKEYKTLRVCKYDQINGWATENRHNCHPNASYDLFLKDNICKCLPGYFGDGKILCKKITNETDQCANICDKRISVCSPSFPFDGYTCVCNEGYEFYGSRCIPSCKTRHCELFNRCSTDSIASRCICDYYAVEADNGRCHIDLVNTMYQLSGFDYLRQLNFSCFDEKTYFHLMQGYLYRILFIFFPINKKDFSTCDRDHYYYGFTGWNRFTNGTSFQTTIRTASGISIWVTKDEHNIWKIEHKLKVLKTDIFTNAVVLYINVSDSIDIAFRIAHSEAMSSNRRATTGFVLGSILLFLLSIILLFIINYRRHTSIFGRLFETRSESNIHFTAENDTIEVES